MATTKCVRHPSEDATHIALTSAPGNPKKWPRDLGCELGEDWVEVRNWFYVCKSCADDEVSMFAMVVPLEDVVSP